MREDEDAAAALRDGQDHQARGEHRRALECYRRVSPADADPLTAAWLVVGTTTAHWALGDAAEALAAGRAAVARATIADDAQVRAAAHVAMALSASLDGDPARVEEEYARAAVFAVAAGDGCQQLRISANRAHHLLADARFDEAVEMAGAAGMAARRLDSPRHLAVALENEAEGLIRLGRHDDAVDRCDQLLALAAGLGTPATAGALIKLADIHLQRGCREQARAALEQALRLHGTDGDRQVRVPAQALLALVLLPEDPAAAALLAESALAEATGSARVLALLAAARTAAAGGVADRAVELAESAVIHARQRRERRWLAEALEAQAVLGSPRRARNRLAEALRIWQAANAGPDAARILVLIGASTIASAADRTQARSARRQLIAAGLPGLLPPDADPGQARVEITTFGRFEVLVDGRPVPAGIWQSRRARDLLRLLVCRRGRALPRPAVCEILWPDDDPERTNHRLSVLLSIVRGVIGPDALSCDGASVALDLTRVSVDVEIFLADVADAVISSDQGADADAVTLLCSAVGAYTDEPFADAPYEDLTIDLREEAQVAYLQALRLLARLYRRAGSHDQAAGCLRRLLGADRYDEDAHRMLIAVLNRAGRHGQARSAADRYRAAMSEIGLRPAV